MEDLTFDLKHLYAEVRESALVPGILLPRGGVREKKNRSRREPVLGILFCALMKVLSNNSVALIVLIKVKANYKI